MKTNYILLGLVLCLVSLSGQTYKNVRAKQDGLSITVQYDMAGKLFRGDKVALTFRLIMVKHTLLLQTQMETLVQMFCLEKIMR